MALLGSYAKSSTRGYATFDGSPAPPTTTHASASWFSWLSFGFAAPVLATGNRRQLEMDDLWELEGEIRSSVAYAKFKRAYDHHDRSIIKAMISAFGKQFLLCGLGSVFIAACAVFAPVVLHQVIDAFAAPEIDLPNLSLWVGAFFASRLVNAFIEAHLTKNNTKLFVRAAKTVRGRRENAARERKLIEANELIGKAQANRPWKAIDRLNATTSRQRLKLRQLKGNRIPGWDRLHARHGCPHCPAARDGGSIPHIFWECPAAQALWTFLLQVWDGLEVWPSGRERGTQQQHAIFDLQLPRFPGRLWQLPDLHSIPMVSAEDVASMHDTAQVAWQQQVLVTNAVIWQWRHNIEDSAQQWSTATARTYLAGALRASTRGLLDRLRRDRRLRDPRRQLLRALASAIDDPVEPPTARCAHPKPQRSVLFFDGGSRGNPGPGGSGAVLVAMEADTTRPRVIWSASMSYGQHDMTNNQAEYLGVVVGLREALARGLRPEVVGDSALVLHQLRCYRPPKSSKLRPLYSEARRLADAVQVDVWQHHLRAYNKMADAAANAAMDSLRSVQVSHPSDRPHTAGIDEHLPSDIQEWHTRHLLRSAPE